jgi:hypothetical protein
MGGLSNFDAVADHFLQGYKIIKTYPLPTKHFKTNVKVLQK